MEELQQAARSDDAHILLLECVRHGFLRKCFDLQSTLLPYWKLREDLYCDCNLVLYGPRVVMPVTLRKTVLTRLHDTVELKPPSAVQSRKSNISNVVVS